jgi:hypothetical protein
MANICYNLLEIRGTLEDMPRIREAIGEDFDFNRIVPMPDEIEDEELWMGENWGCYDIDRIIEIRESPGNFDNQRHLTIRLFTKLWPPLPIFIKQVQMFPDAALNGYYDEDGCRFHGVFTGWVISSDTPSTTIRIYKTSHRHPSKNKSQADRVKSRTERIPVRRMMR